MDYSIEEYEKHNCKIEIFYDIDPINPFEWEEDIDIYYLQNSRYILGNKPVSRSELEDIEDQLTNENLVGFPVYAYIHGGVALSLSSFSCPFDSGQYGFLVFKNDFLKDMQHLNQRSIGSLEEHARIYLDTFESYLNGSVYAISVESNFSKEDERIAGFYSMEDAIAEAENLAYHIEHQRLKEKSDKLKTLIKSNVPISKRKNMMEEYG